MDGRCATCRHWRKMADEGEVLDVNHYVDERGFSDTLLGFCLLTEMASFDNSMTVKAMAFDHEDYRAELWTSPDFGCVEWASVSAN